jgi:glycosyltransferase involved in cell wall biosynthesis
MAGTPVVVADDSGCGEIVRDLPGGQVVPVGDAGALAAAVGEVLRSPEAWRTAAVAGGARVRAAYGRVAVCAAIESVYSELVPPHRVDAGRADRVSTPQFLPGAG